MAVSTIDFDDLPEEEVHKETVTVSMKFPVETQQMLKKIAHRERHNISTMGVIMVEKYINDYVEAYSKSKD